MPLILGTNSLKDTGFNVANSCRFNDGDSAHMHITRGSAGNQRTFTISMWIKRCELGSSNYFFTVGPDGDTNFVMYFDSNDQLEVWEYKSSYQFRLKPKYKFRDIAAWYHLCVAFDTTQSTSTNRVKIYVNGTQLTDFDTSSYPSEDYDTLMNDDRKYWLGKYTSLSLYYDGYLAEVVVLDGTAASPTSFGEFDSDSPTIWKPIDVSGLTFGTNGFYLDFEDSSNLGNDANGGTDWTAVNLAATDQSTDTCTNNFSTFNSLIPNTTIIYQEGNLKVNQASNSDYTTAWSTIAVSRAKWYAEFKAVSGFDNIAKAIGFLDVDAAYDNDGHIEAYSNGGAYGANGRVVQNGSGATSYTTYTNGDIIGIALDLDNGKVYYHKNGTYINSGVPTSGSTGTGAFTVNTGKSYIFSAVIINFGGSNIWEANFGSPSFAISSGNSDGNGYGNMEYSVPSGYYTLCTKNLAEYG